MKGRPYELYSPASSPFRALCLDPGLRDDSKLTCALIARGTGCHPHCSSPASDSAAGTLSLNKSLYLSVVPVKYSVIG